MLRVGVHDELQLVVGVQNLNEEAYDARLILIIPEILELSQFGEMASDVSRAACRNNSLVDHQHWYLHSFYVAFLR